jgi:hypothetical protein
MAVTVLRRTRARSLGAAASVPTGMLLLTLLAPLADLLRIVQPPLVSSSVQLACAAVASVALLLAWIRFPRTSWLIAAWLAALASVALRVVGNEVAPFLSLLVVLALGVGGAFAPRDHELEAVYDLQPSVARRYRRRSSSASPVTESSSSSTNR